MGGWEGGRRGRASYLPILLSSSFFVSACVPLPPGTVVDETRPIVNSGFEALGPGAHEEVSLHFSVKAYDAETAKQVSQLCEADYQRIMQDTNLYSFVGSRPYPITVYRDRAEYLAKTRMPEWSGGVSVGNTLAVYVGPEMEPTTAHEMTHIIFYEVFGEKAGNIRWLNEGLAVYEETQTRLSEVDARELAGARARLLTMPMPFAQMQAFVPASEQARLVNAWYLQASDVVRFMIERGGRLGFSLFLKSLRDGRTFDDAVKEGFPGQWSDARTLEAGWLASLPR